MSFTMVAPTSEKSTSEKGYSLASMSSELAPGDSFHKYRPSFSPRLNQNRTVPKGHGASRLSIQSPPGAELECPFSVIALQSRITPPAELYGCTPSGVQERPVSCPVIPPLNFAKIGSPSTPSPKDSLNRPSKQTKEVYPTPENTPTPAIRPREPGLLAVVQTPRPKSLQTPLSYHLPTPPTSVRKSVPLSPSSLRLSSSVNDLSPVSSISSLVTKAPKEPEIPRTSSPPVLDLRTLPYPYRTHDSDGESLAPTRPTHVYQTHQRQPDPSILPRPNRAKYPHRLPNRLPLPRKNQYLDEERANPNWIRDLLTDGPSEHKADEEPIEDLKDDEDKEQEAMRQKQAKRRSMVPFIEYYDLLRESEEELAVVYNIRTREFRTEKRSSLLERCYRSGGNKEKAKVGGTINLQNECAPALVDGMVASIPLPTFGKAVFVSWLNVLPNDFRYREREVTLPGWVLTGRSMGKIDEIFIEKI